MNELEKLLYLTGISDQYHNYSGQLCTVSHRDRLRALVAMGYQPEDSEAVSRAVHELDAEPWRHWLRPYYIVTETPASIQLQCHSQRLTDPLRWRLLTESGAELGGECVPQELPEVGEYYIGGERFSARALPIADLELGYHELQVSGANGVETAVLIACPASCHQLPDTDRLWGVSCQLYTLRSERNWGIGDFQDLLQLIELLAPLGADLIGLNPLHALCSDSAELASPYSPSDRRFLNPLYIAPEQVPEWRALEAAEPGSLAARFDGARCKLRDQKLVDYPAVGTLKYQAFECLYEYFIGHELHRESRRAKQFLAFIEQQGDSLKEFCRYESRHNSLASRFAGDHRFFSYLQWLATTQLAGCQQRALALGMAIGLLRDLAVGSVAQGSEVEQSAELYIPEVTIGAPPDPIAPGGQDWGLPVIDPVRLRQDRYRHFIDLLRANMAASGALRVDHVMALMRLWWCLPGPPGEADAGLYVYYPREEMLALLRLESQRNACLVVGEDLGVVPQEFRQLMQRSHIYGNCLLYFERHADGCFMEPAAQRTDVLLMVTNHDVPTLADWWAGGDLHRRASLGLLPDRQALEEQLAIRRQDKLQLLQWLEDAGLLPRDWSTQASERDFDMVLATAVHRACARSPARLLLLQLEDLQLLCEPVNIPGTHREYPNWRRKQARPAAAILAQPEVRQLLAAVQQERSK